MTSSHYSHTWDISDLLIGIEDVIPKEKVEQAILELSETKESDEVEKDVTPAPAS